MPDTHTPWAELIERLERATGPDRELDREIVNVFGTWPNGLPYCAGILGIGRFTGSLDAALALVEAKLPSWHWRVGHGTMWAGWAHLNRIHPNHCDRKDEASGQAATPVLALLVALCRALEANEARPLPAPAESQGGEG